MKHRTKLSRSDPGAGWDQCFGKQNHSDWSGDTEYIVHCGVKKHPSLFWIKKKTINRDFFQYREGVSYSVWGFQWRGHFQVGWRCSSTVALETGHLQPCFFPKEIKARNAISIQHWLLWHMLLQSVQGHLHTVLACCCTPGPELCLLNFVKIAPILGSRVLPWALSQHLHGHTQSHLHGTFMAWGWFSQEPWALSFHLHCPWHGSVCLSQSQFTSAVKKRKKSPYLNLMGQFFYSFIPLAKLISDSTHAEKPQSNGKFSKCPESRRINWPLNSIHFHYSNFFKYIIFIANFFHAYLPSDLIFHILLLAARARFKEQADLFKENCFCLVQPLWIPGINNILVSPIFKQWNNLTWDGCIGKADG